MDIVLYVLNELFLIRKRCYFTIKIMRVRLLRQIESDRGKFLGDKEDCGLVIEHPHRPNGQSRRKARVTNTDTRLTVFTKFSRSPGPILMLQM